jgi:hypothetical protein
MTNPLSLFNQDRFLRPAVDAGVENALSANHPPAYGPSTLQELSLSKTIGQPHDADYALLFALYKLNTDVSGCVHKWAGGVLGAGWRITIMDPDAKITSALEQEMQVIERWLRNPNHFTLFESMLYKAVQHFGMVGDAFWYVTEDKKDQPLD